MFKVLRRRQCDHQHYVSGVKYGEGGRTFISAQAMDEKKAENRF